MTNRIRILFFAIAFLSISFQRSTLVAQQLDAKLSNGVLEFGVSKSFGGAITHLRYAGSGGLNLINNKDKGRCIQQSYYAGSMIRRPGQSAGFSPWSWNPIQAGAIGGAASPVNALQVQNNNSTIATTTTPLLWDMTTNEAAKALMYQATTFEAGMPEVARVDCSIVCNRESTDVWGTAVLRDQELPAAYFTASMSKMVSYTGSQPFQSKPTSVVSLLGGNPWKRIYPTEAWVACMQTTGDFGVAVYSPAADLGWNAGLWTGNGSTGVFGDSTVHMAPIKGLALTRKGTFAYRYWLIIGNLNTIRGRVYQLKQRYPNG